MISTGNEKALLVAEQIMDFCYEKKRQEKMRQEWYVQQKKEKRHMGIGVVGLSTAAALMLVLCVIMLTLGMQVRERELRMESLMTEVSALRKENKEAEKRLMDHADYQWIREEAVRLGMSQVTADQVIYYSVENADYMVQLEDIPTG